MSNGVAEPSICILIPTFNNDRTLQRVVDGCLCYDLPVLVVNDGSTDQTRQILEEIDGVHLIHLQKNQGKGNALKAGFKWAVAQGYEYAITIDSDGQHYPEDIPLFLKEIKENGSALLIGARNMSHHTVPGKSSFGNRFSNFWYRFETGIDLIDTQCGFRLYPIQELSSIRLFTSKYEYEIEIIVQAAWKGIVVRNIPIRVKYDPEERVSHFRPFRDFARISVLNTWLVLVSLLYIRPRQWFRSIKKKSVKQFFIQDVLGHEDPPLKKSLSIGVGLLIGLSPFWGLHTALTLGIAILFRLNKMLAFAFSNISLPPMIPLIVWAGLKMGSFLLQEPILLPSQWNDLEQWKAIASQHLWLYGIGSMTLSLLVSVSGFLVSYAWLKNRSRHQTTARSD